MTCIFLILINDYECATKFNQFEILLKFDPKIVLFGKLIYNQIILIMEMKHHYLWISFFVDIFLTKCYEYINIDFRFDNNTYILTYNYRIFVYNIRNYKKKLFTYNKCIVNLKIKTSFIKIPDDSLTESLIYFVVTLYITASLKIV